MNTEVISGYFSNNNKLTILKEDYVPSLEFDFIINTVKRIGLAIDDVKNKIHELNVIYRNKHINEYYLLVDRKSLVSKILKDAEYQHIKDVSVAGLKGLKSLIIAKDSINEVLDIVNKETLPNLISVKDDLKIFIFDKDKRTSFSPLSEMLYNNIGDKIETINNKLSLFVDFNEVTDTVKIGKVLPNLSSFQDVYNKMVTASQKAEKPILDKILSEIDEIDDLTKKIEKILINDKDAITKTSINDYIYLLNNLETLVKLHSLSYYITSEVSKVVINIIDVLKNDKK